MKYDIRIFSALMLLTCIPTIILGQSNIDIIDSLSADIIEREVIAHKNILPDSIFIKLISPDQEKIDYLTIILGNVLTENSFNVYRNYYSGLSFQGVVLEITKFAVNLSYGQSGEDIERDNDYIGRNIVVQILGQIYNLETGRILKSVDGTNSYYDEIEYRQIDTIEKSPYSFTRGIKGEYSNWQSWIEPVIVVASVAVSVFLFFTLRT
jgi:hypothetical protein